MREARTRNDEGPVHDPDLAGAREARAGIHNPRRQLLEAMVPIIAPAAMACGYGFEVQP
jgi:hypothetical protein